MTNHSGAFDGSGNAILTNGINPSEPERYFYISVPCPLWISAIRACSVVPACELSAFICVDQRFEDDSCPGLGDSPPYFSNSLATVDLMFSPRSPVATIFPSGPMRKMDGMPSTPYRLGRSVFDHSPRNPMIQPRSFFSA